MNLAITARLGAFLLLAAPALATPRADKPLSAPASAEQFVQVCASRLALTEAQSSGLREYLEQEINYLAVQRANHTAAEVAELLPAERDQLNAVVGRLVSPTQLRRFRELEATPKMQEYLRQMDLVK
ncbi:hypothetical protein HHL22_12585 [Hymenobacter sp. RP-2-7]|uniref:Periplasmic heavy metal sensor n=1 Tax=Hymenobacter polaris TaxID=2682546 RepID=A0A7Y0FMM7_9BACT|nr:hypothetical protein [Hymenobacter polaris]NML66042.1 hypothetical protein [Hymenobacter polaris]